MRGTSFEITDSALEGTFFLVEHKKRKDWGGWGRVCRESLKATQMQFTGTL